MLAVVIEVVEMLLETFALGFSPWRTLVQDFEVVSPTGRPYYPGDLLVYQRLNIRRRAAESGVPASTTDISNNNAKSDAALPRGIYLSVAEIANELKLQIRLRHSAYYDNEMVITQIADFLAGAEIGQFEATPPSSIGPSLEFWDTLFFANVILWILCALLSAHNAWLDFKNITLSVLAAGYGGPLIFLGISLAFAARRPNYQPSYGVGFGLCGHVSHSMPL